MTKKLTDSSFYYRLGEIIIPLTTWFVILMPVWLSPFHPAIVAYFIIMFDIYFLYKSITTTYLATRSYREVQVHNAIPYASKISEEPKIQGIHHFVIVPNYKEPLYKLEETIETITKG